MDFVTIKEVELFRYNVALNRPLPGKVKDIRCRLGVIVVVKDQTGCVGLGEIAPLPGRSKESLEEAVNQASNVLKNLVGEKLSTKSFDLSWLSRGLLASPDIYPSVRFGIEMALLSLKANIENKCLAGVFADRFVPEVAVNALLAGSESEIVDQAQSLIAAGYQCLKLKVGSGSIAEDIARARAVNDVLAGKALLRIDANKAWTLKDALRFNREVGMINIEYIEEPLQDINDIGQFYRETLIPVALDESLTTSNFMEVKAIDGVEFLVLKPMLLGGIKKTYSLCQDAKACGLSVIISSSFESELGLSALAHLAAAVNFYSAAGLDTDRWLAEHIWRHNLNAGDGRRPIQRDDFQTEWLSQDLLEKI